MASMARHSPWIDFIDALLAQTVHAEDQNRVHHILRAFDLDPTFGPCLGMTRLERWKRANSLGEDPPKEVYDILLSQQGVLKGEYRESCLTTSGA